MSNNCEIRVGRLMEITIDGYRTIQDVKETYEQLVKAFSKVPSGTQVVIAADWRKAQEIGASASHGVGSIMKDFNNHIERSAILAATASPRSVTQYLEVIRKSGHSKRRLYVEASDGVSWLQPSLTASEHDRLCEFWNVPSPKR